MNFRMISFLGTAVGMLGLANCIVVQNVDCTKPENATNAACLSNGLGGSGGTGGAGGAAGMAGNGGAGVGGGTPACIETMGCGEATTTNATNALPCAQLSVDLLTKYTDCVCAQASCQVGTVDAHGICGKPIDYDFVPTGQCETDITANCGTQAADCGNDI